METVKNHNLVIIADPNAGFLKSFISYMNGVRVPLLPLLDGETVIREALEKKPRLIILNSRLGEQSGFDVIDSIRKQSDAAIPFVVIMGDDSLKVQEETVRRQVLCSLLSPPDFKDLKDIILRIGANHAD